MMKNAIWMLVGAAVLGGCQTRKAPAVAASEADAAPVDSVTTAPATAPATVPTTVASTTTGPATSPLAATSPVDRGPRIYVAADADDATLLRNWPTSVNYYPSGHVIAGPVYRIIAPPPRSDKVDDVLAVEWYQSVLAVPQMLATPFWMINTPPLTPVEYHGEVFPPSYTVDDPLPYYVNEKVPGILELKREK
jgi:hypothetical protein